jgi:hypothetical protein
MLVRLFAMKCQNCGELSGVSSTATAVLAIARHAGWQISGGKFSDGRPDLCPPCLTYLAAVARDQEKFLREDGH